MLVFVLVVVLSLQLLSVVVLVLVCSSSYVSVVVKDVENVDMVPLLVPLDVPVLDSAVTSGYDVVVMRA